MGLGRGHRASLMRMKHILFAIPHVESADGNREVAQATVDFLNKVAP